MHTNSYLAETVPVGYVTAEHIVTQVVEFARLLVFLTSRLEEGGKEGREGQICRVCALVHEDITKSTVSFSVWFFTPGVAAMVCLHEFLLLDLHARPAQFCFAALPRGR